VVDRFFLVLEGLPLVVGRFFLVLEDAALVVDRFFLVLEGAAPRGRVMVSFDPRWSTLGNSPSNG
jgi:hypothetical protein